MSTLEILVSLVQELTDITDITDIKINKPLAKQLNQIDLTRFIMDVEEKFWLNIPDSVIIEYDTLEFLAEFLDGELMNQID